MKNTRLSNDKALEIHFQQLHENAPQPFNSAYKSYAKHISNLTVKHLQAIGFYELTLEQRQESNFYRITYDLFMKEYEANLSQ